MTEHTYNPEKALAAQKKYCKEHRLPFFAPDGFICYRCHQNIYKNTGYKKTKGISVQEASSSLITGCPFCHVSFCD